MSQRSFFRRHYCLKESHLIIPWFYRVELDLWPLCFMGVGSNLRQVTDLHTEQNRALKTCKLTVSYLLTEEKHGQQSEIIKYCLNWLLLEFFLIAQCVIWSADEVRVQSKACKNSYVSIVKPRKISGLKVLRYLLPSTDHFQHYTNKLKMWQEVFFSKKLAKNWKNKNKSMLLCRISCKLLTAIWESKHYFVHITASSPELTSM